MQDFNLRFHKASNVDGSGKCSIVPGAGGVYVAVFDIEISERSILDGIEGLGAGYNQMRIQTSKFGICWTYVADPRAVDRTLRPLDWYKEYVLRGARFHDFPADYVARLENVAAETDTDAVRAGREWKNVHTLR